MGVLNGTQMIRPRGEKFTHSLKRIRISKDLVEDFPIRGPHPAVGVDVSIFICQSLHHKASLQEMNLVPKVPVMTIQLHVLAFCKLLQQNNFVPKLVFDGACCPLKQRTTDSRYKDLEAENNELEAIYSSNDETTTLKDLITQQKKACKVTEDILYEVLEYEFVTGLLQILDDNK